MKNNEKAISAAALVILVASCSEAGPDQATEEQPPEAATDILGTAALANAEGVSLGEVTLEKTGDMLSLSIQLTGLEPGTKAFHLHTTGLCEAPDFTSAGGHLNPFDKTHGSQSEGGMHLGDFPNIEIAEDGSVVETYALDGSAGELTDLIFDEDGTAVMIHAGPDDYETDPAGAAGPRIACGVLNPAS